jgi:hypothetical protein
MRTAALALAALLAAICSPALADDPILTPKQYEELIKSGYTTKVLESYSEHSAGATGPTAEARGDKTAQEIAGTAPTLTLPGGTTATGGDTDIKQKAQIEAPPWVLIAMAIGGIGLIAAAAIKATKKPVPELDTAIGLAAAGGICIIVAIYPGFALLLAAAAACVVVPHFLPDKEKQKLSSAFDAAVDGLASASAPMAVASVANQATAEDKAIIEERAARNGNPISLR